MIAGVGCSLTYGSEIEGVDIVFHNNKMESFSRTFTANIALELGMDYCIVAAPGASNSSIAKAAMPLLYDPKIDILLVCWSWMERTNIPFKSNDYHGDGSDVDKPAICLSGGAYANFQNNYRSSHLSKYMFEFWINHLIGFNNQLASLEAFYLVNSTAKFLGKRVYNINMGKFMEDLNHYPERTVPDYYWKSANSVTLKDHPYWTFYQESTNKFFSNKHLYSIFNDQIKHDHSKYINGLHPNQSGHKLIADIITSLIDFTKDYQIEK